MDLRNSHESESETIEKCLQDLKLDSVEVRKRAVLILGKYSNPRARNAIIRSLRDNNADIRRSALVSLTEKPLKNSAVEPMLMMIGDTDVHIRRIASSYIPEIMRGFRFPRHLRPNAGPLIQWSPELQETIRKSFHDGDAIVRKNMLTHHSYFRNLLAKDTLKKLLHDPDRDVRILALNAIEILFRGPDLIDVIGFLSKDPDPTVRLQLTELLGNSRSEAARELLGTLIKDEDFEISTEAYIALFRQPDFSHYQELRNRLDDPQLKTQTARKIIKLFPIMGNKDGANALLKLIKQSDSSYRKTALEIYGQSFRKESDAELFVELMSDQSRTIREIAGRILLQLRKISITQIKPLVTNPYADARRIALTISTRLPRSEKEEILWELILDDVNDIRLGAVREMIREKIDGWEQVVRQTLNDDNLEIQQKTVASLLNRRSKETDEILMEFVQMTDNPILKQMILNQLKTGT